MNNIFHISIGKYHPLMNISSDNLYFTKKVNSKKIVLLFPGFDETFLNYGFKQLLFWIIQNGY